MNKVLLIIQREYMVRVKKKAFLLLTFLVPGLIFLMYFIFYLIITNSDELNKSHTVRVLDNSGIFRGKFHDSKSIKFVKAEEPENAEKAVVRKSDGDYLLVINPKYTGDNAVEMFAMDKPNLTLTSNIEDQMNNIAKSSDMVKMGIDTGKLNNIKSDISITSKQLTDKGEEDANVAATTGAGIAGAILVYLALFIYGAQVMRGVIEEKTSRIIEVIVSSVKPFQLMLGKIVGVGMVGLTQFILWIALSTGVTFLATNLFLKDTVTPVQKEQLKTNQPVKVQTPPVVTPSQSPAMTIYNSVKTLNYVYILGCFVFYFLSGFFLYSALFAAVGSAVDSETETQQFMFPITLPLLFTYFLSFSFLISNPDSSLAVWLSIIPFTAPVAMMVRIPFGVPGWQLGLSMVMMVAGFLFTTWVASRIYRVGILMYGKKASYKELSKWFFYKE